MSDSYLEDSFALWLRQNPDLPAHEREYRFAEGRKWRFDFAWLAQRVAVEIEGITPQVGRHQRLPGFLADAEKYEAALRARMAGLPGTGPVDRDRRAAGPPRLAAGGHGDAADTARPAHRGCAQGRLP